MKRQFTTDDRGVSEVIGAILVFGLLIALMAILQMQAVPAANEEVEFNHNQQVQSDLVKFHETTSGVASGGAPESTRITTGTTYPSRMLFFNPRNPAGEVSVVGEETGSIQNVKAVDEHVDDYIDGDMQNLRMKRLEYRPHYNEYDDPPASVLEYGTVYRDFGDRVLVDNPGQVISGNTISLTFFNGNMSRTAGGSMAIEAQATSAPARTVTVEPDGGPIVLELPTNLNASNWEEILNGEEHVEDVRNGAPGMVEIELDQSQTYNLRMAQIGVGSGVPEPGAHYVTKSSNRQLKIGEQNRLPIEVRDRYNNPVSGQKLYLNVSNGQFQNGQQSIVTNTTTDGQPAAVYTGSGEGVVEVEASFVNDPTDPTSSFDPENNKEDVRFNVTFDPRLDNKKPTIDDVTVTEETFTVCTAFTDVTILNVGTITHCLTTSSASQFAVDFEVSDSGGSGLDYFKIEALDSSGNTILNTTESLHGSEEKGTFQSPQIVHTHSGDPSTVNVRVYDRNGNLREDLDVTIN